MTVDQAVEKVTPALPPAASAMLSLLREVLPNVPFEVSEAAGELVATFDRRHILSACCTAKEHPRLRLDYLRCLSGVELDDDFEVVYHLYSVSLRHKVVFKTTAPKADPVVASVTLVWRGADWHEREAAELFGMSFAGHPNPAPLLLEEGVTEHPLRKDHPLVPIGADRPCPDPSVGAVGAADVADAVLAEASQ